MKTMARLLYVFSCLILLALIASSIYVPNNTPKKALNTLGIKTLGWQSNNEGIVIDHNYSKVYPDQIQNNFGRNETIIGATTHRNVNDQLDEFGRPHDRIRWQRINDHLTELAGMDQFEQPAQEKTTLLQTVSDHLAKFDQLTQDFDSQKNASGLNQEAQNKGGTNNQLSGFDQEEQRHTSEFDQSGGRINDQLSGFDQEEQRQTSGFDQSGGKINDQLSGFDQEEQRYTSGFGQNGGRINDQLSGFDQEEQSSGFGQSGGRINDQLSEFSQVQQTQDFSNQFGAIQTNNQWPHGNLNSTDQTQPQINDHLTEFRQFTNAHSDGYQPTKSSKLQLHYDQLGTYKKCPKQATGQFVYELSCNQFLNCWKGRGYVQNCAPGTLFNPKTLECDFPEKVTCITGPRETPLENREPLSAALQATCPPDFTGIIPHYTDCSKFINCVNGAEFAMSCAPGTLFDVKTNLCDHPYKVECANQETTSDSRFHQGHTNKYIIVKPYRGSNVDASYHRQYLGKGNDVGASSNQQQVQGNININNQLDEFIRQLQYYMNETTTNQSTYDSAASTNYNQVYGVSGQRVDQFGAEYQGRTTSDQFGQGADHYGTNSYQFGSADHQFGSGSQFPSGFSTYNQFGSSLGQVENAAHQTGSGYNQFGSSTQFPSSSGSSSNQFGSKFEGSSGQLESTAHQFGTSHNQFGSGSQFPSSSDQFGGSFNNFGSSSGQIGSTTHQTGSSNQFPSSSGQFGSNSFCSSYPGLIEHPTNCSLFMYCVGNHSFQAYSCESGSFFNPKTRVCDVNYRCPKRQDYILPSTRPKCPSDYVGLLPHPTICAKFLNCANGQTFVQDCGPGTVFNPELKVCDHPYRVKCVDAVIHEQNRDYQTADPKCPAFETGLFPHPTDCAKFLNCANGQTYIQECGAGTVFNPYFKICDHPHRVACGQKSTNQNQNADRGSSASQNQNRWWDKNYSSWNNLEKQQQNGSQNAHTSADQWGSASQNKNWWLGKNQTSWNNQNLESQQRNENQSAHTSIDNQNWWLDKNQSSWNNPNLVHLETQYRNKSQTWWIPNQNAHASADQLGSGTQNQNWWWGKNQSSWGSQWPNQNVVNLETHRQNKSQNRYVQDQVTTEGPWSPWSHKPSNSSFKHSPPPFPRTDTNADYVFEYEDADEVKLPERNRKNFCQVDDFRCSDDVCISQTMVCDTIEDCPDGKDEINCEKYVEQFSVIPRTKLAVREKAKFPNVTITLCAKYCMESKGFQCKSFNFRNNDGTCFIFDTNVGLSGSLFLLNNYDYYEYRKFTVDCSTKYKCANQKCIDFNQVCDGVNDCGDRIDEKGCKAEQLGYSVRLVGTGKPHEGVVEVSAFGRSGYICDDMFGLRDAHVLCRELGFPLGALEVHGNSYFSTKAKPNETFYMMDDVSCLGNETSIRDCDFAGWGVHNCMEQEIIGVKCKTPLEKCPKDYWRCETGNECLPLAFVCDAVDDCDDKSDEGSQYCEAAIELRLSDGRSKFEGRVEIKYHGTWGTICDDDFNDDAAKVVCKYLGHKGAAHVKKSGHFGPGEGPIWLDQIYCQGNETAIQDCLRWDWGEHNCEHSEDVGVVCSDSEHVETVHIEAQRNAKLAEPEVLPRALFPDHCGFRSDDMFLENDEVHFRVVKGSMAKRGDYPWQASLRVKGKTKPTHWCGAVVISQSFVLTAAHCLDGFTKGAYVVVAGDYNVDFDEGTEQVIFIEDFYTHEQFRNGTRMNNDIALIKLKGDGFNFTKHVQPICLPDADFNREKGMNCTISGFGSIQSGKAVASKELRAGWIPIQTEEVCKMPHIYGDAITDGMICAGFLDEGVDACDGDSGGPLACLYNGRFTLMGMTSWGQHCGYANKPGVYVRIAHYRDWIDDTMRKHS